MPVFCLTHYLRTEGTHSLPGATVKGEPVRGGVAGTFFGGSGGGAAKR